MEIRFTPNGKNRTADIVQTLLNVQNGTRLIFENGTYDFYAEGAYCGYFFIGCNRSGEKEVVFPLLNLKDITIDAQGSTFLFHDRIFPFIIQNCENVNFKNFTIDFSFPRCLEAIVERVDEDGFELGIDESFGCFVNEKCNFLIPAGIETFSSSERRFFLEQRSWHCYISVGDIYYENTNLPADVIYCDAEKTKRGFYFRYKSKEVAAKFVENKRLMLSYDELRENDVFFFEYTKNSYIENVRIIHGAGMGIVGQCCENMHLVKYVVSPLDEDMFSTTADGVLLTNFKGKVTLENCRIDRSIDDAVSIHGFYTQVESITDTNKAVVRLVHPSQRGVNVYFPKDRVIVSDRDTMEEFGQLTVKKARLREDSRFINLEFEEPLDGRLKAGDYIANDERTPEIEIKECVFTDFPALRLSSRQKTVFKNNIVKNCNALLVNDLMQYWAVSGCVNDLTIQNNVFENCECAICIFVDRLSECNVKHKNIKIIGNTFKNCSKGISAEQVDGLTIAENVFENIKDELCLSSCTDVKSEL